MTADAWLESLPARHAASMTRSEFLKAIRALSARYVERHGALHDRSPLDSAGKRGAFASFYAPLHFVTTRQVMAAIGAPPGVRTITDAGCGTGVAGAAWGLACAEPPSIHGIDLNAWALDEARATWRALDLRGRSTRGDFLSRLDQLAKPARNSSLATTGIVFGWSLNELDASARKRAYQIVAALAARGARVLILEPISRSLVPWWNDWAGSAELRGVRADEWRFAAALPPFLADLNQEAGFSRAELTARSLAINWTA